MRMGLLKKIMKVKGTKNRLFLLKSYKKKLDFSHFIISHFFSCNNITFFFIHIIRLFYKMDFV